MYDHQTLKLNNDLFSFAEADAPLDTDNNLEVQGGAFVDTNLQLEKEGMNVERAISGITEVQVCEILGYCL